MSYTKYIIVAVVAVGLMNVAYGQTLPSFVAGVGEEWARGSQSKFATDITVAQLIKGTSFYVYGNISTSDSKGVNGPSPSVITAGGAYVAVQSGKLTLLFILQSGFSMASASSSAQPAFSGSVGFPLHLGPSWGVMPFVKCLATTVAPTIASIGSSASVTTIIQLGAQVQWDFYPPIKSTPSITGPSVKVMRAVMRRLHLPEGDVQ